MDILEKAKEIFAWAEDQQKFSAAWKGHSENVAKVAERIASHCGMDADKAYAYGLLHDIAKYTTDNLGPEHVVIGYNMLISRGLPEEAAQICMTHSYYGYPEVDRTEFWEDFTDMDALDFTLGFMNSVKLNDYDRLIQLADNMALARGIMTINNRFCDIAMRYGTHDVSGHLKALYKLKHYFDKKCEINIYELFKDDIIDTVMFEPDGV